MPTEKPRITFALSKDQLERIDTFRFDNKIKNQSQAILTLIEKGLAEMEGVSFSPPCSNRAAMVAEAFDRADERTKTIVELNLEPYMSKKGSEKTG